MSDITLLFTQSPYQSAAAAEGLDFALGATSYGHNITILFVDKGVLQLLPEQNPVNNEKNHAKRLKTLALWDIETLYVCEASLTQYGVSKDECAVSVESLCAQSIHDVLARSDHVVTF